MPESQEGSRGRRFRNSMMPTGSCLQTSFHRSQEGDHLSSVNTASHQPPTSYFSEAPAHGKGRVIKMQRTKHSQHHLASSQPARTENLPTPPQKDALPLGCEPQTDGEARNRERSRPSLPGSRNIGRTMNKILANNRKFHQMLFTSWVSRTCKGRRTAKCGGNCSSFVTCNRPQQPAHVKEPSKNSWWYQHGSPS